MNTDVESIRRYFSLSDMEMRRLMERSGVMSYDGSLTQDQIDRIYDVYLSNSEDEESVDQFPRDATGETCCASNYESLLKRQDSLGTFRSVSDSTNGYLNSRTKSLNGRMQHIPPSQIVWEYSRNRESTRAEYMGKWMTFSGTIQSIEKRGSDFIVRIMPEDRNFHGLIVCCFNSTMERVIAVLSVGQDIIVCGMLDHIQLQYENDAIEIANSFILSLREALQDVNGLRYHESNLSSSMNSKNNSLIYSEKQKKDNDISYVTCSNCNRTLPAEMCYEGVCWICLQKLPQEVCTTLLCCECGILFDITDSEYQYCLCKGLSLPQRCPDCRRLKGNNQETIIPSAWETL